MATDNVETRLRFFRAVYAHLAGCEWSFRQLLICKRSMNTRSELQYYIGGTYRVLDQYLGGYPYLSSRTYRSLVNLCGEIEKFAEQIPPSSLSRSRPPEPPKEIYEATLTTFNRWYFLLALLEEECPELLIMPWGDETPSVPRLQL